MHFYVDETGQTGRNLFDKTQPILSYGVLSSEADLDKVAEADLAALRKTLGVERLHAAELGVHRLSEVVDTLLVLQKNHRIRFDIWQVVKRDHAIISFFDQVFDQGLNPVVPWSAYWTPLRYPLLLNLSNLFDDELAEKAWRARLEAHDERSCSLFSEVCGVLLQRVHSLGDARSVELITDALSWAMVNFDELGYNCKTNKEKLQIMPNMIGFQSVLHGICSRLGAPNRKADIIVDQQSQFIDRNLNPQKTKKAPQNGCFFNTPCAPYERKRLLNRMTLIDTGYEWRFFAPFPVKWTQLPLCGSQPHTCCRASRSCIRTSSASR